jgi:chromosomal replication initiation ATPase DnaA
MTPHQLNKGSLEFLRRFRINPERRPEPREIAVRTEIERVCKALSVSMRDVLGGSRKHYLCMARAIIAYNLRNIYKLTLEETGKALHRNHGTIISALKNYDNLKSTKDRRFLEMLSKTDGKI